MSDNAVPARRVKAGYIIILITASAVVNLAGFALSRIAGLPMMFDTVGTVLASLLGGYLPGIAAGLVTNLAEGALSSESVYYCAVNMLAAGFVNYMNRKGLLKKAWGVAVCIVTLSLMTGTLASVLTWLLNGFGHGGLTSGVALRLAGYTGLEGYPVQLLSNILTELCDKTVTVTLGIIIFRLIPEKVRHGAVSVFLPAHFASEETRKAIMNSECRSMSLKVKVMFILVPVIIFISGAAAVISYMLFKDYTVEEHTVLAERLTDMAAEVIDADMTDVYIREGRAAGGYEETEKELYTIMKSSPEVQYLYVYKIMEDGCHVVFDMDSGEVEGSSPGEIVEFDESFMPYLPDLLAGKPIDPIISNDQFGWLLTVYKPLYDAEGVCRCYAAVDVSMERLSDYSVRFLAKLISILIGIMVMVLVLGVWLVENNVVIPVNTLAYCAGGFAYTTEEAREENVERLRKLEILTGDEIENLYKALLKTTGDSMQYVADIQNKTETISRMQNGLIMVLADMVESRDKCTGDHVRKTTAYAELIMQEMKKRGFYKESMTDGFIANVINAAPLHDIGKIKISDVILNKPGRLTDEEFEIMKKHTLYGSEIIDRAIELVPDSDYLVEAKNVSRYHHEKWNGKGYPLGLSGEDIPLSARIMAVADVFDALVSRRSYKEPFPFEKAMDIIGNDAGSHFDPLVAEAFLGAADRVREITERFEEMNRPVQ